MKKLLFLLSVLCCLLLTACSCREYGCSEAAFHDGYCEYHYSTHLAEGIAHGLLSGLFGG